MNRIYCLIVILFFFTKLAAQQNLLLFGGSNKDLFLGCLSCNSTDSQSVWNPLSIYGSKTGAFSIWNKDGSYGSDYSPYSAFNPNAVAPPVVKDREGNFYGYFTANQFMPQRFESEWSNPIFNLDETQD